MGASLSSVRFNNSKRVCHCGTEFVANSPIHKFCSAKCRPPAKKGRRVAKVCVICNLGFTQTNNRQVVCSDKCRTEHKKRQTAYKPVELDDINCKVCARVFKGKKPQVYCSDKCRRQAFASRNH